MRKLNRVSLGLIVACLFVAGLVMPVWAIGDPDYVTIEYVSVFADVLESGDQLYFVRYDVSYDPVPNETAEDTWQMALYDTDGTTLIATRPLEYYQHNIRSIYLTADQALTWEAAYQVKVMGMPSVFDPLVEGTNMRTVALSSGDYKDTDDLSSIMIAQAEVLEADWEITLLTSGKKLNSTGSIFFLEAVPGLNTMVPGIFETTVVSPSVDYINWSTPYSDTLEGHEGSRLRGAIQDIASLLHMSESWTGAWFMSMVFLLFAGAIYAGTRNPSMSLIGAFPVLVGGVWLGVGGPALLTGMLLIVFIVTVIFAIYFILGRFA